MKSACPAPGELRAYASGAAGVAPDPARARVEAHAAECGECRGSLALLGMLRGPESEGERALLDRVGPPRGGARALLDDVARRRAAQDASARRAGAARARPRDVLELSVAKQTRRAGPRWARLSAIAATAALAALALFVWRARPGDPREALAVLQDGTRPLELAFSDLPYAPYQPRRGDAQAAEARFDRPLRELLEGEERARPDAARLLATLYVLRRGPGDAQRAEALLARAGGDADSENDRAVLSFASGDLLASLEALDRALEQDQRHRAARLNRALLLSRLGFDALAAASFEELARDEGGSPWAAEARGRAQSLRALLASPTAEHADARSGALTALLTADSPAALARARAQIARLPAGSSADLARLGERAARESPEELAAHGRRYARYQMLRAETLAGRASPQALDALVRDASGDPLLLVPALQLSAYRAHGAGERRREEELDARALRVCRAEPCDAIGEAISADELAEDAGRDGDYASAHRLQDRAEALLVSVGARLQQGELQAKRSRLLVNEGRLADAARASLLSLRTLAPLRSEEARIARAGAAGGAAEVALARGLRRAALELHRGGLSLLDGVEAADVSAELTCAAALDEAELGQFAEARPLLGAELARQLAAGRRDLVAQLRSTGALLALRAGDAAGALEEATRAQGELASEGAHSAWSGDLQALHVLRARALLAARGDGALTEARGELQKALESARREEKRTNDAGARLALAQRGAAAGAELAALGVRAGLPAAELLLPLDSLREALFAGAPARELSAQWPARLLADSCLLAFLPAEQSLVRLAIANRDSKADALPTSRARLEQLVAEARRSRDAGAVPDPRAPTAAEQALSAALFGALPPACLAASNLWLWVESPLEQIDLSALPLPGALGERASIGFTHALSRLLAPEPAWPPSAALLLDGAEVSGEDAGAAALLPAAARERELLGALLGDHLSELQGPLLTPAAALARLRSARLVHAAVHGASGGDGAEGSLQLSGESGRLRAQEIARARLPAGARVVLSACHAAPGESGLALAFARAGAVEVAAAEGAIDDAAAARWAEAFYPALARGLTFAQANHEALRAQAASGPRAWFVVSK